MTYIDITMPNVMAFVDKLKTDKILGREWSDSLRGIVELIEKRAKARAPVGRDRGQQINLSGHGSIPAGISHVLDSRQVPTYGKVTLANLTKPGGKGGQFRYAGALQGSKRYHYSSNPTRTTWHWFSGAVSKKVTERLLQEAADRIAARWSRS